MSLLFGIMDLVEFIIKVGGRPIVSGGWVGGGVNLTGELRELLLVASFAPRPLGAAPEIIMNDDRLPRVLPEIGEELLVELQYVAGLPDVWGDLACMTPLSGPALHSRCIAAAMTSAGYITHKFQEARTGVWALLQGDRLANVQALAGKCKPEGEDLGKIWDIMRLGLPASLVVEGLEAPSKVS